MEFADKNINAEIRYNNYGIDDFKLRNINDLYQLHGINIENIEGYDTLNDLERYVFKKFIVNYYNVWEVDTRDILKPLNIYRVQQIDLLYYENDEPVIVGYELARFIEGEFVLHEINIDEGYRSTELERYEPQSYLRFEYEKDNKNEWLHIVDEKTWY